MLLPSREGLLDAIIIIAHDREKNQARSSDRRRLEATPCSCLHTNLSCATGGRDILILEACHSYFRDLPPFCSTCNKVRALSPQALVITVKSLQFLCVYTGPSLVHWVQVCCYVRLLVQFGLHLNIHADMRSRRLRRHRHANLQPVPRISRNRRRSTEHGEAPKKRGGGREGTYYAVVVSRYCILHLSTDESDPWLYRSHPRHGLTASWNGCSATSLL
jgi:hypothetical protein